jgi:hypothetical protein
MKPRFSLAAGLAAAALLAVPSAASAHTARPDRLRLVTIASCRAQGDFATCDAAGTARKPVSIHVHVTASPGQKLSFGGWDTSCAKGTGAGGETGSFGGWASLRHPNVHKARMAYRDPDSCVVSAGAQLNVGGHLHLWITAWRRP